MIDTIDWETKLDKAVVLMMEGYENRMGIMYLRGCFNLIYIPIVNRLISTLSLFTSPHSLPSLIWRTESNYVHGSGGLSPSLMAMMSILVGR